MPSALEPTSLKKVVPERAVLIPKEATRVFKGQIFDVYQWPQQMFDGSFQTFEMLRRPDTLQIIAIKDGKIVILEEEQPNLPPYFSIPGGRHDVAGETTLQAAQRELLEETGLTFASWKLVDVFQNAAKIEHFVYTYVASDFLDQVKTHLDVGEKIQVNYMDLEKVKRMCDDPKAKGLPKELLVNLAHIDDLLTLPEFTGQAIDC